MSITESFLCIADPSRRAAIAFIAKRDAIKEKELYQEFPVVQKQYVQHWIDRMVKSGWAIWHNDWLCSLAHIQSADIDNFCYATWDEPLGVAQTLDERVLNQQCNSLGRSDAHRVLCVILKGWREADRARMLNLNPGYVTRICNEMYEAQILGKDNDIIRPPLQQVGKWLSEIGVY